MATANGREVAWNNTEVFEVAPSDDEFIGQGCSHKSLRPETVDVDVNGTTTGEIRVICCHKAFCG